MNDYRHRFGCQQVLHVIGNFEKTKKNSILFVLEPV